MTLYFYRDTNLYLFVLLSGSRPKSLFWVYKALSGLIPPSFPVSISITLSFPSVPLTVNLFYLFKWAISLPATSSSSCLVAWEGQSSLAHWTPIHLSKYHFLREAFLAFQVGSAPQLQTLKTSCTFSLLYDYLINVFYLTWLWASGGQGLSQILVIIILTDLVFCLWPHSPSHPFIIYCLFLNTDFEIIIILCTIPVPPLQHTTRDRGYASNPERYSTTKKSEVAFERNLLAMGAKGIAFHELIRGQENKCRRKSYSKPRKPEQLKIRKPHFGLCMWHKTSMLNFL